MLLTVSALDGTYRVQSHGGDHQPAPGDAHLNQSAETQTVIENGMTFRKDAKGFIWESTFTILDSHHVEMVSVVDPSHGGQDAFVLDEKGNPTKGMVTYKAVLTARHDNGQLVLQGDIHHNGGIISLTMTKIA